MKVGRKRLDHTDKVYNYLKGIRDTGKLGRNGDTIWEWKCLRCGKVTEKRAVNVVSGRTKSCGCLKHKARAEDQTGKVYNYLIGLDRASPIGKGSVKWNWKCTLCGTVITTASKKVKSGYTMACWRCLEKIRDFKGKRFNQLEGIKFSHYTKENYKMWRWKCLKCGEETLQLPYAVIRSYVKDCGCSRKPVPRVDKIRRVPHIPRREPIPSGVYS